jgi:hypothetical protein
MQIIINLESIPNNNIFYFPKLVEKYNQTNDLYIQCTDTDKAIELYEYCEYIERFIKMLLSNEPLTEINESFIKDIVTNNFDKNEYITQNKYLGYVNYTTNNKKVTKGYKNRLEYDLLTEYLKSKKIKFKTVK